MKKNIKIGMENNIRRHKKFRLRIIFMSILIAITFIIAIIYDINNYKDTVRNCKISILEEDKITLSNNIVLKISPEQKLIIQDMVYKQDLGLFDISYDRDKNLIDLEVIK